MRTPDNIKYICDNIENLGKIKCLNILLNSPKYNENLSIINNNSLSYILSDYLSINIEWDEFKCCVSFENNQNYDRKYLFEINSYNDGINHYFLYTVFIKKYGFFRSFDHNCPNFENLYQNFDASVIKYQTECLDNIDFCELQKLIIPEDFDIDILDFSFLFYPKKSLNLVKNARSKFIN